MFALGVELLMRRAIITRWGNREESEWPPHPDRVFMALVAAWGECGEDTDQELALRALEKLGPPALRVCLNPGKRTPYISYVPANDDKSKSPISKKGKTETPLGSVPFGRARSGRSFPAVVPDDPTFHLVWPEHDLPEEPKSALAQLCTQVTYLGHSATPIRMWVERHSVEPNLIPTDGNTPFRFRVFGPGRLEVLEARYNRKRVVAYDELAKVVDRLKPAISAARGAQKKELQARLKDAQAELDEQFDGHTPQALRPLPGLWQGYAEPTKQLDEKAVEGPWDASLIVLRQVAGRTFSLESCGMIAEAIRHTLMSRHGASPPEWLSGHAPDGSPSTIRRPVYLPLGFVGRENADGHLLGVAIAVPREFSADQIDALYDLLGRHDGTNQHDIEQGIPYLSLRIGRAALNHSLGCFDVVLDESLERNPKRSLKPSTWTAPACRWTTVTPVILPRFPRRHLTPEDVIAKACGDAGYPDPISVRASLAPLIKGVSHARLFHPAQKPGIPPRPVMHATIQFPSPLHGPVIIGMGRYGGFGFCRPLVQRETK